MAPRSTGASGPVGETHGGVGEIRPGLAVPHAELHDLHALAVRGGQEARPEVPREPVRLEFQFAFVVRQPVGGASRNMPSGAVSSAA